MDETTAGVSLKQLFKNKQFATVWIAQFISSLGDWLAIMALFRVVAFQGKGSPYEVAGIMISFIMPWAFLGPVAGVFVDRWDVKRTMIASDLARAVIALAFAFATQLYQLYALVFALSAVSTFFVPAQSVAIRLLVRKEELLLANSINTQAIQINKIFGPSIAVWIAVSAGAKMCFYIDTLTFIFSALMLLTITVRRASQEQDKDTGSVIKEFREGLRFTITHKAIFFVILSLMAAIFAIAAFDALIAVYVRDLLHEGDRLFGALVSIVAVGTIIGGAIISRFSKLHSKVHLVIAGILLMGISVFILATYPKSISVFISSVVLGMGVAYVLIPSQTLIQEETPQEMLGRVSSTSLSLMTVSQLMAFAVAGAIAQWIGIINLYYTVAAVLILIAAFGYLYARWNRVGEIKVEAAAAAIETQSIE